MATKTYPHDDEINCIAFSKDYEFLITGSNDKLVRIFNCITGKFIVSLVGHESIVKCVDVSNDSKYLASGDNKSKVIIWRTRDACLLFTLQLHRKSIQSIRFSHDSQHLATASYDKSALLWSVVDGSLKKIFEGHDNAVNCLAFNYEKTRLATGSKDCTIRIWMLESTKFDGEGTVRILNGHTKSITDLSFSKQGMLASSSHDKTIRLWNVKKGYQLKLFNGHETWTEIVSFSTDGFQLISASKDSVVKIWDVLEGKCQDTLEIDDIDLQFCSIRNTSSVLAAGCMKIQIELVKDNKSGKKSIDC